jgi:hypothetical protein
MWSVDGPERSLMISRTVLSLVLLAAAAPAFAQDIDRIPDWKARAQEEDRPIRPTEQLFISPAGEPFRAPLNEPYPVERWFAHADANHDGAIDHAEFTADQIAFFERLDANHDGLIDGFESQTYEKTIVPEIAADTGQRLGPPKGRGFFGFGAKRPSGPVLMGASAYNLLNEPLPDRTGDINFDYKLTRDEALAVAARRFDMLDKNKDGRLTLSELPKTPVQAWFEDRKK